MIRYPIYFPWKCDPPFVAWYHHLKDTGRQIHAVSVLNPLPQAALAEFHH